MFGEATEKVPGGKLVRIKVNFMNLIKDVQITGDFFLHPEECVHEIENSLKNTTIDFQQDEVVNKVNEILKKHNAELIGVHPETIAKTLKTAIENGKVASITS